MGELKYYRPKTLEEAQRLLIDNGPNTIILNGGTFVVSQLKRKLKVPDTLIDIKGIESLKNISFSKEKGLYIGATITLSEIYHNKDIVENYKVLSDAVQSVGSVQIRNRVTLAGNNCTVSPFADTSTALLVLDAVFEVYSDGEIIDIPAGSFYKGFRKNALSYKDIVIGIKIPYYENLDGVFTKISRRKEFDLATISTSVVKINDKFRIAMGTVSPVPIRATKAEEYINNKNIDFESAKIAGDIAMGECRPVDDLRSSKEYRLKMVKVAIKRSLIELSNMEETYNV